MNFLTIILFSTFLIPIFSITAFASSNFLPDDYDIEFRPNNNLEIVDATLMKNNESVNVVIWDVTSLEITIPEFWGTRDAIIIYDFTPANCIKWTNGWFALSCIYKDTYEVFLKTNLSGKEYDMMKTILNNMELNEIKKIHINNNIVNSTQDKIDVTTDKNNLSRQTYLDNLTLKQQIENNFPITEISCINNLHVLVERPSGKLACVYETTVENFNWLRIIP